MLTFDDSQWAELTVRDTKSFIAAVCDQYLSTRPEMAIAPGRDVILIRMNGGHAYAIRIGFSSTPHIGRGLFEKAWRHTRTTVGRFARRRDKRTERT